MRGGIEPVYIDDLTGVLNRRYLYDRLHYEVEMAERENTSLWMAVIDIDDFKAINDTYGHLEGDNILREVASIFRRSVRATDKVIRFGGDEFVILPYGRRVDIGSFRTEKGTGKHRPPQILHWHNRIDHRAHYKRRISRLP